MVKNKPLVDNPLRLQWEHSWSWCLRTQGKGKHWKSHGQRSLAGCNPWGHRSRTQLSDHTTEAKVSTFSPQLLLQRLHHLNCCSFLLMVSPSVRYSSWQPTPVFLPGESQGERSLVGYRLWGHIESDTPEAAQQQQHVIYLCISSALMDFLLFGGVFFSCTIPRVEF